MTTAIDLQELSVRESEQTEWKENVADMDDVVATLSAFANDLANLGGGYVVCGAREDKDQHGFPVLVRTGLAASRLKEVENTVLARCRDRVSPPITPLVEELPSDVDGRRILVFIQPATGQAHMFRRDRDGAKHFVRVSRSTIEARNGVLRDLLVRKGALLPWDRQPCPEATIADIDLVALRDALVRIGVYDAGRAIDEYLSDEPILGPFVPSLCVREPLTGILRPRNFALLLFGREPQRFIPGAIAHVSKYPGGDRSTPVAIRHDLAGTLLSQATRLLELLESEAYIVFNKEDAADPNQLRYPKRALDEALVNALVHRDYALYDPLRVTVFEDRIEIVSPGSLPPGMSAKELQSGKVVPKWRNQSLAWFALRLGLAQVEGQGIITILRTMKHAKCPPPRFSADETRVTCVLLARRTARPEKRTVRRRRDG